MTNTEPRISAYLIVVVAAWVLAGAAVVGELLTNYDPLGTLAIVAALVGALTMTRRWIGCLARDERDMFELGRESVTVARPRPVP